MKVSVSFIPKNHCFLARQLPKKARIIFPPHRSKNIHRSWISPRSDPITKMEVIFKTCQNDESTSKLRVDFFTFFSQHVTINLQSIDQPFPSMSNFQAILLLVPPLSPKNQCRCRRCRRRERSAVADGSASHGLFAEAQGWSHCGCGPGAGGDAGGMALVINGSIPIDTVY